MKRTLKILASILAIVILLVAGAGIFVWLNPTPIARWVAEQVPAESGWAVEPGRVSGNPISGYRFYDWNFSGPGTQIHLPELAVELSWLDLLKRQITIKSLKAREPDITLTSTESEKDPDQPTETTPPKDPVTWVVMVPKAKMVDGTIRLNNFNDPVPDIISSIQLDLAYKPEGVTVHNLEAFVWDSSTVVKGRMGFQPLYADLRVDSRGFIHGNLEIKGSTRTADVRAAGRWAGAALDGSANLSEGESWRGEISIDGWTPNMKTMQSPLTQGVYSGRIQSEGKGFDPEQLTANLEAWVQLNNNPVLHAEAKVAGGMSEWRVSASTGEVNIELDGNFVFETQYLEANVQASSTEHALQEWTGTNGAFEVKGSAKGVWPNVTWDLAANIRDFEGGGATLATGNIQINAEEIPPTQGRMIFDIESLQIGERVVRSMEAVVDGSMLEHRLRIQASGERASVDLQGLGSYRNDVWAVTWDRFDAVVLRNWKLQAPFRTTMAKNRIGVENFVLTDGKAEFHADGTLRDQTWEGVRLRTVDFEINALHEMGLLKRNVTGGLNATIEVEGGRTQPEATIRAHLSSATMEGTPVGTIDALASVRRADLFIEHIRVESPTGRAFIKGHVPLRVDESQGIEFDLQLTASDLDVAPFLDLADWELAGVVIHADLQLKRTGGEFAANGNLKVNGQTVFWRPYGIHLTDVNLIFEGQNATLVLHEGTARSGRRGTVALSGKVDRVGGDIKAQFHRMEFHSEDGFLGQLNADIALGNTWERPAFSGAIRFIEGRYEPERADRLRFRRRRDRSEPDPTPAPPAPSRPNLMSIDLVIHVDGNVWYRDGSTAIEMAGQLNVQKEAFDEMRLYGSAQVVRGDYVIYGRVFKIERGEIRFVGETPVNPMLDIAALHVQQADRVRIHLNITGTRSQPVLKLTSDPPLEETDIISILITGRPMYDMEGDSDADSAIAAKQLLAGYVAEELRRRLQTAVDLDVLRFDLTGSDQADITVGKAITRNLFISYGQTLGEMGERRINTEYRMTRRLSLEGYNSSTGRYVIDFLYKFGF